MAKDLPLSWLMAVVLLAVGSVVVGVVKGRASAGSSSSSCDLFQGRWVADASYPLYNTSSCPFLPDVFDCRRNGRPDDTYLKFRWSPAACRLPTHVTHSTTSFSFTHFDRRRSDSRLFF